MVTWVTFSDLEATGGSVVCADGPWLARVEHSSIQPRIAVVRIGCCNLRPFAGHFIYQSVRSLADPPGPNLT